MDRTETVAALDTEIRELTGTLQGLTEEEARRPTRCAPWDVAALAEHTVGAVHRLAVVLDGAAPARAEVSALGYYSPDVRFSDRVNRERVDSAMHAAALRADPGEPGRALEAVWLEVEPRLLSAPAGRTVLTRHGDAMLLDDFLVTRVVELLLHGLDLADALERGPWTTAGALAIVERLLFGGAGPRPLGAVGLTALDAVRAATGRALPGRPGREALDGARVNFLALG
ncbi:maleylpyruvate isomerase N-terminal domain-containing protein [Nocardiopsis potens]|uniref:maleylpyruvate isomerase N-terminal domain-containing protein n=1 Tax=Nocardiopsis potens TaxID=1246458 RepID=UPI00034DC4A7|nr:maleylpyruvate isomerase N-terminal domain-containing protein [Nocardiopsis potens]